MTYEEFKENFSIQLNEQQSQAVRSVEGATLLLAVPGSGKTTVLITRLGYMILCKGIAPEEILTITYTVAATKDMSERFSRYFGEELKSRMEFRTINGICAKIIAYYGRVIGKNAFELVTDDKKTTAVLAGIFQKVEKSFATESDLSDVRTWITYIKNMMLTEEEICEMDKKAGMKISEIYKEYKAWMRQNNLMDYDDQMVYALTILKCHPPTLSYFQNKYKYICVDEAQDTSKIQHEIISLLAKNNENLFMVGDEDQSIYGFRAAYPEALLNFEKNHPNAKVLLMEENFRSGANIVAAADQFIQKNTMRHKKSMRTSKESGEAIKTRELKSRSSQYAYLLKVASECDRQTAILYRDHESVLPLVDSLERGGIPYRMRSADLSFFTNRIVLDILNIIRFAKNPMDTELFLQIYYKLSTYISKPNALKFCDMSKSENIPVLEAAVLSGELPAYTVKNLRAIQTHLTNLLTERADKAIYRIVNFMGYGEYLERMNLSDGKIFILKELAAKCGTPQLFLERMEELQILVREKQNDDNCPLILSTIHASKGLEFERVFLMDVADGIFPEEVVRNPRLASEEELCTYEEERRLFYVGVTRAKEELNLFRTDRVSTFIKEFLGESDKVIEMPLKSRNHRYYTNLQGVNSQRSFSKADYQAFCDKIRNGAKIEHKKFGEGVINAVDGDRVVLQFAEGTKMLSLRVLFEKDLLKVGNEL